MDVLGSSVTRDLVLTYESRRDHAASTRLIEQWALMTTRAPSCEFVEREEKTKNGSLARVKYLGCFSSIHYAIFN